MGTFVRQWDSVISRSREAVVGFADARLVERQILRLRAGTVEDCVSGEGITEIREMRPTERLDDSEPGPPPMLLQSEMKGAE